MTNGEQQMNNQKGGKDYFEIDIVIDDKFENDDGEYPDYYKAVFKKYKVKLEYIGGLSTEWMHKASGKKSDILAWGLGKPPIGFGVSEKDIADYFRPHVGTTRL